MFFTAFIGITIVLLASINFWAWQHQKSEDVSQNFLNPAELFKDK